MRLYHIVACLSLVLLVSAALAATNLNVSSAGRVTVFSGKWFDYVVVIMMENHGINSTYGVSVAPNSWNSASTTCLGNCTFFDSLANGNGLAEEYTNNPVSGGSAGDYVAITSGNVSLGSSCNGGPTPGCTSSGPNIVDRLEAAHLTWKAYMEGCPAGCGGTPSGCANLNGYTDGPNWYQPNHNPFIYYSDIQNNATRCANIVSPNSANPQPTTSSPHCAPIPVDNDDLFINDLGSTSTASNYMFLTPDAVDDNHDCNDVTVGNAWLQQLVPQILNSTVFKTKRAALFVTFDEPYCTFSGCPPQPQEIYAVWASNHSNPTTRVQFKNAISYTHLSQLRTVEDNWGLPTLVPSEDGSSNNMKEFFP